MQQKAKELTHSLKQLNDPVQFNLVQFSSIMSNSFPVSQFFTSADQSIGASASASVLPINIQD